MDITGSPDKKIVPLQVLRAILFILVIVLTAASVSAGDTPNYSISVGSDENGTVTLDSIGGTPVAQAWLSSGTTHTIFIRPADNYAVAEVLVDGISVGAVYQYTFKKIHSDHSVTVIYKPVANNIPPETVVISGLTCVFVQAPTTEAAQVSPLIRSTTTTIPEASGLKTWLIIILILLVLVLAFFMVFFLRKKQQSDKK